MDLDVTVHGDDDAERKLRQLVLHLLDLRGFWPLIPPLFIGWMGSQFQSEGGWGGQQWAPLSPAYAVWKQRHYPGRTILIRDRDLRQAASRPRREVTPRTLTLWIDDPKVAYHQEGGGSLPARPLIPERLPPVAVREVEQAGEGYVSVLVRNLGL